MQVNNGFLKVDVKMGLIIASVFISYILLVFSQKGWISTPLSVASNLVNFF
jgi:hypothetical protein